jgi:peptidyl-prolyl cis-trans isomerase B (cyclophilin B)
MSKITIATNKGNINLNLFDNEAPLTVASFLFLIRKGFFTGLAFHRVIADFMIQGGDPLGNGTGSPKSVGIKSFSHQGKEIGYPFSDEFKSGRKFDKPGILAMANSGPNSNGSQFFITHIPTPWLTNKHTIFGEVISVKDQEVVNSIQQGDKILRMDIK